MVDPGCEDDHIINFIREGFQKKKKLMEFSIKRGGGQNWKISINIFFIFLL